MPTVIKCIVSDKKVVEVLRALKPYALDPPVADPIDDGPLNSAQKVKVQGDFTAAVVNYVNAAAKAGKKTVLSTDLKKACMDHGGQHNSYSYALKLLLKRKKLKRTNIPKTYEIIR